MTTEHDGVRPPWTTGCPVPVNPTAAVAGADWAIDRYRELGIRAARGDNRLQQARGLLARFAGRIAPLDPADEELLSRIVESTQTCFEHYLIARSTGTPSGRLAPEHLQKIEESLTGAATADEDANSIGRDTQFELLVRAVLVMGDVPVRIAEPDLRFLYASKEAGLAAKRVKRLEKLRPRFREAVEQIERAAHGGFVAVNADLVVRDLGSEGEPSQLGARFQERLDVLKRIDEEFVSHPLVMGRLVFGNDAVWHFGSNRPRLEFHSFRQYRVYAKTDEETEAAERFFSALSARIDQRMEWL